jgi:hypothetical protein
VQVERHGAAHDAEADEPDLHAVSPWKEGFVATGRRRDGPAAAGRCVDGAGAGAGR